MLTSAQAVERPTASCDSSVECRLLLSSQVGSKHSETGHRNSSALQISSGDRQMPVPVPRWKSFQPPTKLGCPLTWDTVLPLRNCVSMSLGPHKFHTTPLYFAVVKHMETLSSLLSSHGSALREELLEQTKLPCHGPSQLPHDPIPVVHVSEGPLFHK